MKFIAYLLIPVDAILLASCQSANFNTKQEADSVVFTSNDIHLTHSTPDKNGCSNSTGFIWSKLKKQCIQPWEDCITLQTLNAATNQSSAYVFVDRVKGEAEVFIPNEHESIILNSDSEIFYTNGKFNLTRQDTCWTLSYKNMQLYQELK